MFQLEYGTATHWLFLMCAVLSLLEIHSSAKSFKWRDLTEDELKGWYNPVDLCALTNDNKFTFPQDYRAHNCTELSRGSRRMHCGVGMGANNYPCYPPFGSARPSFKRGIDGYADPNAKPMRTSLKKLIASNTTLILLGDSTMRQKLQALECQIIREIPGVKTRGNFWGILPCETKFDVILPSGEQYTIIAISVGPNSVNCLKAVTTNNPPEKKIYENAQFIIQQQNEVFGRNVLVVANMGLWYNDPDLYRGVMPSLLDWLVSVVNDARFKNKVAWHDTVSQHWISTSGNGYFDKSVVDQQEADWPPAEKIPLEQYEVPTCCMHISNSSYMADWRNDIALDLLASSAGKYSSIKHFPQVDITRPVADLHTCNQVYRHDCTHYCYTPLLHQVLWHQIMDLSKEI